MRNYIDDIVEDVLYEINESSTHVYDNYCFDDYHGIASCRCGHEFDFILEYEGPHLMGIREEGEAYTKCELSKEEHMIADLIE